MIKFRTEKAYGNGGHSPAEILAYETLSLGNTWILDDLYLMCKDAMNTEDKSRIEHLQSLIEHDKIEIDDEDLDYVPYLPVFESLINALSKVKGITIKYLLWLTDLPSLLELYYNKECNYLEDIDGYETGIEIIHFEGDGNLYAYEEKSVPLSKDIVKEHLDNCNELYKVYVYPGFGVELQTLYFDHSNISLEEIGYVCYSTNKGYFFTEENIQNEPDISLDDQYTYIDLSSYDCPNIYLFTMYLTAQENVEIFS